MSPRDAIDWALKRAREYVALNDPYMAGKMTQVAALNAQMLRNAETQRLRVGYVSISINEGT
jgi:hypothetical protein